MLKVTLVTPEKKLFENKDASEIFVPGYEGELNILEGHAAFMTTLETGTLRLKSSDGNVEVYLVTWGYCEVNNDHVKVLAETAESVLDIDKSRAQEAYERAQKRLEDAGLSVEDIEKHQRKLMRADLRISLAQEYRENH